MAFSLYASAGRLLSNGCPRPRPKIRDGQEKLNALAMQHRESWRVFHQDKHSEIRYEIAPMPSGQVAMRMQAAYCCGDNHTVAIPWRLYPSREEALRAFLEQAKRHFTIPCSSEQQQTQKRMLALVGGMAPACKEPEPEPIQEEKPIRSQVATVQAKREKSVQRELF